MTWFPPDANRDHYDALADFAKKEHDLDVRPIINNQLDFSGRTLVPFNTHMGSGDGGTYRTIRRLAPEATVLEGLPLSMQEAEAGGSSKINSWLKRLGLE